MSSSASPTGATAQAASNVTHENTEVENTEVPTEISLNRPKPRGQARDLPEKINALTLDNVRVLKETDTDFENWLSAVNRSLGPHGLRRLTNDKLARPKRGDPEFKLWFYYSQKVAAWLLSHVSESIQLRISIKEERPRWYRHLHDKDYQSSEDPDFEYDEESSHGDGTDVDDGDDGNEDERDPDHDMDEDEEDFFADHVMRDICGIMLGNNASDEVFLHVRKFLHLFRPQFKTANDYISAVQSQYISLLKKGVGPPPFFVLSMMFDQLEKLPIINTLRYELSGCDPKIVSLEDFSYYCQRMHVNSLQLS